MSEVLGGLGEVELRDRVDCFAPYRFDRIAEAELGWLHRLLQAVGEHLGDTVPNRYPVLEFEESLERILEAAAVNEKPAEAPESARKVYSAVMFTGC